METKYSNLAFVDVVLGVLSLFAFIASIAGFVASYFHSIESVFLQWMSLLLPGVLLLNAGLGVYLLLRKRLNFVIPLLAIMINVPFIARVIQMPFAKNDSVDNLPANSLSVASYNVHETFGQVWEATQAIADFLSENKIDVFCVQEFPQMTDEQMTFLSDRIPSLPYTKVFSATPQGMRVALFSRYPIVNHRQITFPYLSKNGAMYADISVNKDTFRIINNHLQTTNVGQSGVKETKDISCFLYALGTCVDRINNNFRQRGIQADSIRQIIEKSPYPLIVCGDFNDTPASYTYANIRGKLKDSFVSSGKGYEYTYRYFMKLFRVDYIFYSPQKLKSIRHFSPNMEYSDHKPVVARFEIIPDLRVEEE